MLYQGYDKGDKITCIKMVVQSPQSRDLTIYVVGTSQSARETAIESWINGHSSLLGYSNMAGAVLTNMVIVGKNVGPVSTVTIKAVEVTAVVG